MKKKLICIYICMILIVPLFTTTISANQPPTAPHIEGPTTGAVGDEHEYGVCSEDPDGDSITYIINWDDGTEEQYGPAPSGVCLVVKHTWSTQGKYTIRVKVSDGQAESETTTLTVTMPRTNIVYKTLFQKFFQNLPNLFPILQKILLLQRFGSQ